MRLKTKSMKFSAASSPTRNHSLSPTESPTSESYFPPLASPATRPTPTTDIGLSTSRSAPPNAAFQTPTMRSGTWTSASAVPADEAPDDAWARR